MNPAPATVEEDLALLPPLNLSELPSVVVPSELVNTQVLRETQSIHQLLHTAAKQRLKDVPSRWRDAAPLLMSLAIAVPLLVFWQRLPLTVLIAICFVVLLGSAIVLWRLGREWSTRDVDTVAQLGEAAQRERDLIRKLLPYSRASLLHVAATARAADSRVGTRLTLVVGANRAGGLLGSLLVLVGAFSAGKYLQDMQVTLFHMPITASGVIATVFLGYCVVAALLLAGHSVNALPHYADLLERVAALKKNLAEDRQAAKRSDA
ncbi:hypothetical protein [Deinococcus humi]|uniref:Uncharacterized protein n=1 Tax=Deinococcus humi TaxID=662880 RepID=A0A7W8NGM8_9DEIO|nr:hypothetical protein [Deinococcus humi]MBB5365686.1 hypothetical protein [Deinococcus humi]GGO37126.1 hypothetical protein GCM10008949_41930 [Deinococcus humi]